MCKAADVTEPRGVRSANGDPAAHTAKQILVEHAYPLSFCCGSGGLCVEMNMGSVLPGSRRISDCSETQTTTQSKQTTL